MALIDEIESRYSGRRTEIEVPEWGSSDGEPLVLYAKPYTIADERYLKRWVDKDSSEGYAEICVRKLEDFEGRPCFQAADRVTLVQRSDAHVVKRVAMLIMTSSPSVEEASGN